jgi:condensin complex subunit 3
MEIVSHDLAELANDDAESEGEMKKSDKEFAISELLKLAVNLDYADEIGRRKMFGLVRK